MRRFNKFIAFFIFLAVLSGVAFLFTIPQRLQRSNNFLIQNIVVRDGRVIDFSYLKGKNLLTLDLARESNRIMYAYPDYKRVRLVRVLPNTLFADCMRRKPVAYVNYANRNFYIDEQKYFFSLPSKPPGAIPDVPRISGIEKKMSCQKGNKEYNIPELTFAIEIIKEAQNSLKNYHIRRIDVANINNASIFVSLPDKTASVQNNYYIRTISPEVEVKIGFEDLKTNVGVLSELLKQMNNEWGSIQYIDLRFKEPVIKLNETKEKARG